MRVCTIPQPPGERALKNRSSPGWDGPEALGSTPAARVRPGSEVLQALQTTPGLPSALTPATTPRMVLQREVAPCLCLRSPVLAPRLFVQMGPNTESHNFLSFLDPLTPSACFDNPNAPIGCATIWVRFQYQERTFRTLRSFCEGCILLFEMTSIVSRLSHRILPGMATPPNGSRPSAYAP